MRVPTVAALMSAAVFAGSPGVAAAAPRDYCAELKGVDTGQGCQIQLADSTYQVSISFPTGYPDLTPVADYIGQTRDGFLNVAESSTPRDMPYELDITATSYQSAVSSRGTQSLVLQTYENVGGAHPETLYKAFNWDQTAGKAITYDALWQPGTDPLKVVFPIVLSALQKQTGQDVAIDPTAGLDPANYQDFALTNDAVIFFFSQGELLPEAAGATQVVVPRSAIEALLA
ncbi:immunogenic protein MPB64 [Mycolicibacterium litorale]|nr:immunogenic protein MPB64 [Mycolicibacterium litorale]